MQVKQVREVVLPGGGLTGRPELAELPGQSRRQGWQGGLATLPGKQLRQAAWIGGVALFPASWRLVLLRAHPEHRCTQCPRTTCARRHRTAPPRGTGAPAALRGGDGIQGTFAWQEARSGGRFQPHAVRFGSPNCPAAEARHVHGRRWAAGDRPEGAAPLTEPWWPS